MEDILRNKPSHSVKVSSDSRDQMFVQYLLDYNELEVIGTPMVSRLGYTACVRGPERVIRNRFTSWIYNPTQDYWEVRLSGVDVKNENITGTWFRS